MGLKRRATGQNTCKKPPDGLHTAVTRRKEQNMGQILVWVLAACMVILCVHSTIRAASITVPLVVWYLLAVFFLLWGAFYEPVTRFCAHGVGRFLQYLLLLGVLVFLGLAVFVAAAGGAHRATGNEQAIIVLGAGLKGDTISNVLCRRLDAALEFAGAHPELPVVVTGGQGPGENRPEAHAMREYLLQHGLEPSRVLAEDRSTSTQENLRFALQVLAENGYHDVRRVAVVTNRFHCYRARLIAGRQGLEAATVPASLRWDNIPSCYVREVLAVLFYWIIRRSGG